MNLAMDGIVANSYSSCSQKARVVTEGWAAGNLFCAACANDHLERSPCNTRAVDFTCHHCGAPYQLKSGKRWSEDSIPDAGYEAMAAAIAAGRTPTDPEGDWSPDWAAVWLETGDGQPLPPNHPLAPQRADTDRRILENLLRLNHARASAAKAIK